MNAALQPVKAGHYEVWAYPGTADFTDTGLYIEREKNRHFWFVKLKPAFRPNQTYPDKDKGHKTLREAFAAAQEYLEKAGATEAAPATTEEE